MPIEQSHTASGDFNTAGHFKVASSPPVHRASKTDKGVRDLHILTGHHQM